MRAIAVALAVAIFFIAVRAAPPAPQVAEALARSVASNEFVNVSNVHSAMDV